MNEQKLQALKDLASSIKETLEYALNVLYTKLERLLRHAREYARRQRGGSEVQLRFRVDGEGESTDHPFVGPENGWGRWV